MFHFYPIEYMVGFEHRNDILAFAIDRAVRMTICVGVKILDLGYKEYWQFLERIMVRCDGRGVPRNFGLECERQLLFRKCDANFTRVR